ncbi:MAG: chalcone isomerase family protein [Candidatus Omnitrophota bacterium]
MKKDPKVKLILTGMLSLLLVAGAGAQGVAGELQTSVVEPVTGIAFPSEVRFSQDGEDHTLRLTGIAARTKWFFRVYAIAHYLEIPRGAGSLRVRDLLVDGPAKQLTIQYARNVPAEKIIRVLREDFELNTTPSEYREIEPLVEQMLGYFVRPVNKGDVFVMRWISGGRVYLELNGQKLGDARSELFARTLWAIWFGDHSVVDSQALMASVVRKEGA